MQANGFSKAEPQGLKPSFPAGFSARLNPRANKNDLYDGSLSKFEFG
jgi:hypothetical protein